jgi:hypothetical protein
MRRLWLALLSMVLVSCATLPPVVLGGCVIPEALDYEAQGPTKLDETKPLPIRDALVIWGPDRSRHADLARDFNSLLGHCKSDPQK